ncbi:MAG: hypothetical protein IJD38_12700, partial [Clostridia bacterium]|nr:hypothetical protein [Clostridia bacterium]
MQHHFEFLPFVKVGVPAKKTKIRFQMIIENLNRPPHLAGEHSSPLRGVDLIGSAQAIMPRERR